MSRADSLHGIVDTVLLDSHYLNRTPRKERPTAHLPYDQGFHLVRAFLTYASHHTVEEVQAFMSQWVPAPSWIRLELVTISDDHLARAAEILELQLGPEGIRRVGGRKWWHWRKPKSALQAEWIEMKSLYAERRRQDPAGKPARRVMFYVHGGAYYMGSVDEHRYQLQRHARKLRARVFAPRYRLAPQFPFPCGMYDCLAAYLHLLSLQDNDASTIVLAGDSAGGGMVLSLLVIMRDQGIPLPAGAILISPWVDLTHSFPSLSVECPLDYIPSHGFHQRPSMAWPPPTEAVLRDMHTKNKKARAGFKAGRANTGAEDILFTSPLLSMDMVEEEAAVQSMFAANNLQFIDDCNEDGKPETIKVNEQIQLYTTNNMLDHPLVSPALQPTLGGLPPLLVIVGGGEILRDEQMYIAHKCADPAKYAPPAAATDPEIRALVERYPPTDVQLQVWDDLCHVAPTLSFTRPAKYMYRSVAQFGAWALSKAQKTDMEIIHDDDMSHISSSSYDGHEDEDQGAADTEGAYTSGSVDTNGSNDITPKARSATNADKTASVGSAIGKAGDPLPQFTDHMIRQRVTRHGDVFPLAPATELPGPRMALDHPSWVGIPKRGPVHAWTAAKQQWDSRYSRDRSRTLKKRMENAAVGFESFGPGEHPPPSSLAARIKVGEDLSDKSPPKQNHGMALWSLWGSKHDEITVEREGEAEGAADASGNDPRALNKARNKNRSRSRSQRRTRVRDEPEPELLSIANAEPKADPAEENKAQSEIESAANAPLSIGGTPLTAHESTFIGASGKRPFVGGIASPFSLNKEADSASMVTLHSTSAATETTATGDAPAAEAR
ncbi:lipase esterase [Ophiostoma piceae UAMH 11346]|uniref:Lipase esterase n=1 Tax=Ophiostoma piceae (strain UAMH 11346) TaxID=1262450 RepID=S3CAM0_OPHP1|nr:lipase esterase [Ophiostoma piceae UAMH 11346]